MGTGLLLMPLMNFNPKNNEIERTFYMTKKNLVYVCSCFTAYLFSLALWIFEWVGMPMYDSFILNSLYNNFSLDFLSSNDTRVANYIAGFMLVSIVLVILFRKKPLVISSTSLFLSGLMFFIMKDEFFWYLPGREYESFSGYECFLIYASLFLLIASLALCIIGLVSKKKLSE